MFIVGSKNEDGTCDYVAGLSNLGEGRNRSAASCFGMRCEALAFTTKAAAEKFAELLTLVHPDETHVVEES